MEILKLTNLGVNALTHYAYFERNYKENTNLKKQKIDKIWDSDKVSETFINLFTKPNDEDPSKLILKRDDSYVFKNTQNGEEEVLVNNSPRIIEKALENKLVIFSEEQGSLDEIDKRVNEEGHSSPASYINNVVIDITDWCNFNCRHCYKGGPGKDYGLSVDMIKEALEPFLMAGIQTIGFTGGESTLREKDMFDIIDHAVQYMELKGVSKEERLKFRFGKEDFSVKDMLKTDKYLKLREQLDEQLKKPKEKIIRKNYNEYPISKEDNQFTLDQYLHYFAGKELEKNYYPSNRDLDNVGILSNGSFGNKDEFIKKIKKYGNLFLQVSLDSLNGHLVNRNRRKKGHFGELKKLAKIAEDNNYKILFDSIILGKSNSRREKKNREFFSYHRLIGSKGVLRINSATTDEFDGITPDMTPTYIGSLSPKKTEMFGWCHGHVRPRDIWIRPNGNVGTCTYGGKLPSEYGNLYENSMADIINDMQNSNILKMFKDGRIERYQYELNNSLFSKMFISSCEPTAITLLYGMLKEGMMEQGMKEKDAIKAANIQTAKTYNFIQ